MTLLQAVAWWRANHAILINATDSLPNWAFLLEKKRPAGVGELIFFRAPPSRLLQTHFGAGEHLFGKRVAGVAGDVVSRDGRSILVNGRIVAVTKARTRLGVPLEPIAPTTIPHGCYFAVTDHKDGFDSRYAAIGIICRDRVLGTARAIL
jgi:conjugal transfer pilin signal peptidase TrbI